MKTVSTKLDNTDFEKFEKMCIDDEMCASEWLRESIKDNLRAHEEAKELAETTALSKPKVEPIITIVDV